jgi:serine/threonine protein kinase
MRTAISKYQIQKILGEGGMGKVYQAIDPESGLKVAIKELYSEQASNHNLRQRFQREAVAMSSLNHPNIVKFYELLDVDSSLFIVMEYAEGQTLENYISKVTGPIPEDKAIALMESILNAFSYAHEKGIIHRDIKPNNIMISPNLDIKILDFGIAKLLNDSNTKLTSTGTVIGTSCYMSPEQAQGLTVDIRTDIYSLGILLFHIITSKPPYDVHTISDIDIRLNIIRNPLPQAKDVYSFVSDHIQQVIDKATNKNMTLRYQSCKEFITALKYQESKNNINMKTITIGRTSSCDVVINDPNVSRVHAEISISGSQYVYRDVSTNGSLINGFKICNDKMLVNPGSKILLANSIPLPWERIYALLPINNQPYPYNPVEEKTHIQEHPYQPVQPPYQSHGNMPVNKEDKLGVGWGILAFFIPISGWIMYFVWKDETPNRAKQSGLLGLGGFILGLIKVLSSNYN